MVLERLSFVKGRGAVVIVAAGPTSLLPFLS